MGQDKNKGVGLPERTQLIDWQSAGITHKGNVRVDNEDAYIVRPADGVWAVADGMGGHHAGEVASRAVVDGLAGLVAADSLNTLTLACRTCLDEVNMNLYEEGQKYKPQMMGTTVVVMMSRGWQGAMLWAGDSRGYLLRDGKLSQITKDHSRTNELIELGILDPDSAEAHPDANVITRAVGVTEAVDLDEQSFEISAGDVFLVCSDGLSRYLTDEDLLRCLQIESSQASVDALLKSTLKTSARDNITAIVIRAEAFNDSKTVLNFDATTAATLDDVHDDDATLINHERSDN